MLSIAAWEGRYSEELFPWCSTLGNATSLEEFQKRTRKVFCVSEVSNNQKMPIGLLFVRGHILQSNEELCELWLWESQFISFGVYMHVLSSV